MPFVKKPQVFSAKINELTLGTGDKAVTMGGQNVYNLYSFDAPMTNAPRIGIDVSDDPEQPCEGLKNFYAGCDTLAQRAAKAASLDHVDFAEKDADLFANVSEALQGKNILVLSAKEENYKGIAAGAGLAYGQKVGAESAVDINLAKQLNVLITQMGVETWGVKEATAPESDVPEWGCQEERGIDMEVETAAACLAYGSDAVILKHPESIKTISQLVAALM